MNITSNYKFCVREWTYVRMARRKVIIVLKFNHKCILAKMFTLIPSLFRFSCTWLVFSGCGFFFQFLIPAILKFPFLSVLLRFFKVELLFQ